MADFGVFAVVQAAPHKYNFGWVAFEGGWFFPFCQEQKNKRQIPPLKTWKRCSFYPTSGPKSKEPCDNRLIVFFPRHFKLLSSHKNPEVNRADAVNTVREAATVLLWSESDRVVFCTFVSKQNILLLSLMNSISFPFLVSRTVFAVIVGSIKASLVWFLTYPKEIKNTTVCQAVYTFFF